MLSSAVPPHKAGNLYLASPVTSKAVEKANPLFTQSDCGRIWVLDPFFEKAGLVIWVIFLIDFTAKFTLAAGKGTYLKQN